MPTRTATSCVDRGDRDSRIVHGNDVVIGPLRSKVSYDERLRPVVSRTMRSAEPNATGKRSPALVQLRTESVPLGSNGRAWGCR